MRASPRMVSLTWVINALGGDLTASSTQRPDFGKGTHDPAIEV